MASMETGRVGWMVLEYKFNKFTIDNDITGQMRYVGSSLKEMEIWILIFALMKMIFMEI